MKRVIEKRNKYRYGLFFIFLLLTKLSFSQKGMVDIDSIIIWNSKKIDSLSLNNANVNDKIWTNKTDSINVYYYRNLSNDSISLRINDIYINQRVLLSNHINSPRLIGKISKQEKLFCNNFELIIYDSMRKINFKIDKKTIEPIESIILTPIFVNTQNKDIINKDFVEVILMEYEYADWRKFTKTKG